MARETKNHAPSSSRSTSRRGVFQAVLVLIVLLLAVVASFVLKAEREEPTDAGGEERELLVKAKTVNPRSMTLSMKSSGRVRLANVIEFVPQVSGRVTWVDSEFGEGDEFRAGQVLFRIDSVDYELAVRQQQAKVAEANRQLALEKARASVSQEEWELVTEDKPIPDLVARQPQLAQAVASVRAARARLAEAELALNRTSFSLPFDGYALESAIALGQYLQAGQSYGRGYAKSAVEVVVSLEKRMLEWFGAPGDSAAVYTVFKGMPMKIEARVRELAQTVEEETQFARVLLGVKEGASAALRPNEFVAVELFCDKLDKVWLLPNAALQAGNGVWLIENERLRWFEPKIISTRTNTSLAIGAGTSFVFRALESWHFSRH